VAGFSNIAINFYFREGRKFVGQLYNYQLFKEDTMQLIYLVSYGCRWCEILWKSRTKYAWQLVFLLLPGKCSALFHTDQQRTLFS